MLVWLYPVNISEGIAETVTLTYREGGVAKDFTGYTATWRVIQEGAVWASGTATLATGLISVPMSAAQTAIPKPTKAQKLNAAAVLEVTATNGGVTIVFNATVIVARREDSESGLGILSSAPPETPPPTGRVTPFNFGAIGDGTNDDRPAFAALEAHGEPAYVPKPPVAWNLSSPITITVPVEFDPSAIAQTNTANGDITYEPFFYPDNPDATTTGTGWVASIDRRPGRMFVGPRAADALGARFTDAGGNQGVPVASTLTGAGYAIRDASFLSVSDRGGLSVVGYASNENMPATMPAPYTGFVWPAATIGVAGFVEQQQVGKAAWSGYFDGVLEVSGFLAVEIAHKNRSSNVTMTPYAATGGGAPCLWLAGGGDPSYGGASTFPNSAGMVMVRNGNSFNSGIIFRSDSLTGVTGAASEGTRADAVAMSRGHNIAWFEPTTGTRAFSFTSAINTAAGNWYMEAGALTLNLYQPGGVLFAQIRDNGASGVDYPVLQNGTGTISMRAEGASANIDLLLSPKGTGRVRFGTRTASVDVPVTGYIEILDAGGAVRRLAVVG